MFEIKVAIEAVELAQAVKMLAMALETNDKTIQMQGQEQPQMQVPQMQVPQMQVPQVQQVPQMQVPQMQPQMQQGQQMQQMQQMQVPQMQVPQMQQGQQMQVPQMQGQMVQQGQQGQAMQVPVGVVEYSQEQLAAAAGTLMDAGRRGELVGLLQGFGASSLTTLPRELYGAFANGLRGLGAKL